MVSFEETEHEGRALQEEAKESGGSRPARGGRTLTKTRDDGSWRTLTAAFSKWPRNELSGETELLEAHLIVVADATILLNAEDLGHIDAWNGDEGTPEGTPEEVRIGWHTTLIGRKLDQGILVKMVFEDTEIRGVHQVTFPPGADARPSRAGRGSTVPR